MTRLVDRHSQEVQPIATAVVRDVRGAEVQEPVSGVLLSTDDEGGGREGATPTGGRGGGLDPTDYGPRVHGAALAGDTHLDGRDGAGGGDVARVPGDAAGPRGAAGRGCRGGEGSDRAERLKPVQAAGSLVPNRGPLVRMGSLCAAAFLPHNPPAVHAAVVLPEHPPALAGPRSDAGRVRAYPLKHAPVFVAEAGIWGIGSEAAGRVRKFRACLDCGALFLVDPRQPVVSCPRCGAPAAEETSE
jgi:hypothetical protein